MEPFWNWMWLGKSRSLVVPRVSRTRKSAGHSNLCSQHIVNAHRMNGTILGALQLLTHSTLLIGILLYPFYRQESQGQRGICANKLGFESYYLPWSSLVTLLAGSSGKECGFQSQACLGLHVCSDTSSLLTMDKLFHFLMTSSPKNWGEESLR